MNEPIYSLFDQREKLGEPPWSGPALEAWERAHGHDARLKCYPEFGCAVLEAARERLYDAAAKVAESEEGRIRTIEDDWEAVRVSDLEELRAAVKELEDYG